MNKIKFLMWSIIEIAWNLCIPSLKPNLDTIMTLVIKHTFELDRLLTRQSIGEIVY